MRIILLEDVQKIGKKHDVKTVSDGFARNFLIPKGMAKPASDQALKWLDLQRESLRKKSEEGLKKSQDLASGLEGLEVVIPVKVGKEQDQLFESITCQKISEKLKELGFGVKKSQIILEKPIKETGEFPVKIHFDHNLEVEVRVIITEEK